MKTPIDSDKSVGETDNHLLTQEEMAEVFGVTKSSQSKFETALFKKLRMRFGEVGISGEDFATLLEILRKGY